MAKKIAILFGVILVLAGLLGFFTNPLIGGGAFFDTNAAHDILNIVLGLILLVVAGVAPRMSALWLKILGVVLVLIAIAGFVMIPTEGMLFGMFEVNAADHWLQLVLGILFLLGGFLGNKGGSRKGVPPSAGMPTSTPSM